jgi:glycosyltransferase involved in cell wall biosynthesis
VVVVSAPLADEVVRLGVDKKRVSRMPMAVDLDKFSPAIDGAGVRERLGLQERFVIGYVGTLAGWHGIRLIHELALELRRRQAPPFVLLIVGGEGEKLDANCRKSAEAGLEGTLRFIGSVAHAEVPARVRAFDVALVPDMTYWSSPAKLFEYQAAGVPVLAPDYPAIHAAMDDGLEGFIFPPRSVQAMADATQRLMADPVLRARMGQAARRRAESEHSWEANAKAIIKLFEEMRDEIKKVL